MRAASCGADRNGDFSVLLFVELFRGVKDFLEDRVGERREHFGAREDVFSFRNAEFRVGHVAELNRRRQLVEDAALPAENRRVNVGIVTARNAHAPMPPAVRSEVVEELVRDFVAVLTEDVLRNELHRFALILIFRIYLLTKLCRVSIIISHTALLS